MEMESTTRLCWISVVVLVFCVCSLPRSAAETEACRKVYREGGAMAVIRSPECPRWGHSLSWGRLTDSTTVYCSEAILDALGRDFTHNHFFCDVDIRFPLRRLQKEATLGIVAIFDGYYSNEASEMAWKYIEEYFFLHMYFLFDRPEGDNFDGSSHVKMLKEALVRAIRDLKNRYTATIIVMVDDHLFLSSLDGSAEVATGSYSRWMAASQSQSQSMREVSSRRLDGDGWGYSLENLIYNISGNMVICVEDETNGTCLEQRPSEDTHFHTKMRIIDFGSAVDEFTRKHLYGLYGPSSSKQTYYYIPPEALLNASWFQGSTSTALKYDLWSVGVMALEMIVGTPYVFQLSHRSYAVLTLQSDSLHEDEMNLLFRFRSFAALCNKMPRDSEHLRGRREKG